MRARSAGAHTGTAARRGHRGTGERPGLGLQRLPGPAEHCRPPPVPGPAASGARRGGGQRTARPRSPGPEARTAAPAGRAELPEPGGGRARAPCPGEPAPG